MSQCVSLVVSAFMYGGDSDTDEEPPGIESLKHGEEKDDFDFYD